MQLPKPIRVSLLHITQSLLCNIRKRTIWVLAYCLHNFTEVRRLLTSCYGTFDLVEKKIARLFFDLCLRDDARVLVRGVSGEQVDEEEEYEGAETVH